MEGRNFYDLNEIILTRLAWDGVWRLESEERVGKYVHHVGAYTV